jgi:hypothetical protein
VNPSYARRYVVRATGVQALPAYIIQTTAVVQMYDCLALCYTVLPCSDCLHARHLLQFPTCESVVYSSTTGMCALNYVRYVDSLYVASGDINAMWLEPIYY